MMYCARSMGGMEQWHIGEPPPEATMRIPEIVRKCVVFVGYRMASGEFRFAGTAFFMGRFIDDLQVGFKYVVTARHVVDGIRDLGLKDVFLRMNKSDGTSMDWFQTNASSWLGHPDGPSVDVAVLRLHPNFQWNLLDHKVVPVDIAVTPGTIIQEQIGVGEDVFTIGLFHHHKGNLRNIPIARVGTIAAMPEEKIATKLGPINAYLIEARSIGGLSGSPVFVHLGALRIKEGEIRKSGDPHGMYYLLGMMFGHFDDQEDFLVEDSTGGNKHINVGIGIVIPVDAIMETLKQKIIADSENQIEKRTRDARMPTMDEGKS